MQTAEPHRHSRHVEGTCTEEEELFRCQSSAFMQGRTTLWTVPSRLEFFAFFSVWSWNAGKEPSFFSLILQLQLQLQLYLEKT